MIECSIYVSTVTLGQSISKVSILGNVAISAIWLYWQSKGLFVDPLILVFLQYFVKFTIGNFEHFPYVFKTTLLVYVFMYGNI